MVSLLIFAELEVFPEKLSYFPGKFNDFPGKYNRGCIFSVIFKGSATRKTLYQVSVLARVYQKVIRVHSSLKSHISEFSWNFQEYYFQENCFRIQGKTCLLKKMFPDSISMISSLFKNVER